MKLAYIIENVAGSGGLERAISTKSNYLAEYYSYEITIITIYQEHRPFTYQLHPTIKTIDLGVSFESKMSKKIKKRIHCALESVLMKERFDICMSLCGMDVYSLYKINDGSRKIAEYHFDYTTFDMWARSYPCVISNIVAALRRRLFIKAVKEYDSFVVLTDQDACRWKKHCDNVVRIYNPLFVNVEGKRKDSTKTVCAIGRLDFQKGYDLLIPAWQEVAEKHPDWKLNIYGDGSQRERLQELIDTNNLGDYVKLCGYCDNVGEALNSSEIFVFPSRYEGFGLVLIEAMAYGVPPVSFDSPCGPREIIENNKNGIIVPYLDTKALIKGVLRLIEDSEYRFILSKQAKIRSSNFSMNYIMKEWKSLIERIVDLS